MHDMFLYRDERNAQQVGSLLVGHFAEVTINENTVVGFGQLIHLAANGFQPLFVFGYLAVVADVGRMAHYFGIVSVYFIVA